MDLKDIDMSDVLGDCEGKVITVQMLTQELTCDVCGRLESRFYTLTVKLVDGSVLALNVCVSCAGTCLPEEVRTDAQGRFQQEESERRLAAKRKEIARGEGSEGHGDFLEELSADHPEFFKALTEFQEGAFVMDDGSQDPEMTRIVVGVVMGKIPILTKRDRFRKLANYYHEQIRTGEPVLPYKRSGAEITALVDEVLGLMPQLVKTRDKAREAADGICKFFKDREYLTMKQVNVLQSIVARAQ